MAIDSKEQFVTIVYEYLYNHGNRLELEYKQLLDNHYRVLFSRQPEKRRRKYIIRLYKRNIAFITFFDR